MQAFLEVEACTSLASFLDASGALFTWPALDVESKEGLEFSLETYSWEIVVAALPCDLLLSAAEPAEKGGLWAASDPAAVRGRGERETGTWLAEELDGKPDFLKG